MVLRGGGHLPSDGQMRHMLSRARPANLLPQLGPTGEVCVLPHPLVTPLLPQANGMVIGNHFSKAAGAVSSRLLYQALGATRGAPARPLPFAGHGICMIACAANWTKSVLMAQSVGRADAALYPREKRCNQVKWLEPRARWDEG